MQQEGMFFAFPLAACFGLSKMMVLSPPKKIPGLVLLRKTRYPKSEKWFCKYLNITSEPKVASNNSV
jgi:hypothetical protein